MGINGQQIGSSQQTGTVPITVPGVVGVVLLQVNASAGRASSRMGTASDLFGQQGQAAGVLTAAAVGGAGVTVPATPALPATGGGAPLGGDAGLGVPSAGVALGLSGLLLLVGGGVVLAVTLRRRRVEGRAD